MAQQQKVINLSYEPQARQRLLHETTANWVFFGGSVMGGKSHCIRWDLIGWCLHVPGIDTYLFRRTLGELEDNHIRRIRSEIPPELGSYNETRKRMEFFNGSGINFAYCEKEQDVTRYQGAEIHVLGVDEASHLTEYQLNYLLTRNRLGEFALKVPERFQGLLPRAVLGSNPGGPGHGFLKSNFIDPAPPETIFHNKNYQDPDDPEDKGKRCVFIPSKISDNKFADKNYKANLRGLPEALQRALMDGDWDAVVGQALESLSRDKHMLRPFQPPRHWTHFCVMDWGTAKPFSVGWYAVSDGAILAAKDGWPERYIPRGALVRYAEWYGWNGKANQGCRMESPFVARKIAQIERDRNDPPMDYRVIDAAAGNQHDGPSVIERMFDATDGKIAFRISKKGREAGYAEVLARLAGEENDQGERDPMLFVTADCMHFWRSVPSLTLDETNPEKGPSTKLEDHVYDEVAYACMSRPYTSTEDTRYDEEERELKRAAGHRRGRSRYG